MLPGLAVRPKAQLAEESLWASIPGGRAAFEEVAVELQSFSTAVRLVSRQVVAEAQELDPKWDYHQGIDTSLVPAN